MPRPAVLLVWTSLACVAVAGCSDSGGTNELDRIDGPAVVDPDFSGVDGGDGGVGPGGGGGDDTGSGG